MVKKMQDAHNIRPDPDPTALTTQQLFREIASLKELLEVSSRVTDTRLAAMDKAIILLQAFTDKSPTTASVAASVENLRELMNEKFNSVALQFKERDMRIDQSARDSKIAIDAALKSQQEAFTEQNKSSALAISKSEAATTKQIDQIGITASATMKATNDKIDDAKERLTRIEGHSKGIGDGWGYLIGLIGAVAAFAAILVLVLKP